MKRKRNGRRFPYNGTGGYGICLRAHLSAYLQALREAPKAEGQDRIYTHGEKENEAKKDRLENGIPVNENTMAEVLEMCQYLDMDFSAYFGDYKPGDTGFKGNFY